MAHHYPKEFGDRHQGGANTQQQDQQPLQPLVPSPTSTASTILHSTSSVAPNNAESTSISPTFRLNHARSNPIAIRRSRNARSDTSDDDDDSDDSVIDVELDAMKLAARSGAAAQPTSKSLPSRLLRAPMLGSRPINEDRIAYQNMLPPAMELTASNQRHDGGSRRGFGGESSVPMDAGRYTAYGSLRESHMQGRFLDGPCSYRDRQTGDIRRLQHRVRFRETSGAPPLSASVPLSLSIGERILRKRQEDQASSQTEEAQPQPTSTLAAMLEASKQNGQPNLDAPISHLTEEESQRHERDGLAYFDDDEYGNDRSNMLSASLTGLEFLQSIMRPGTTGPSSTTDGNSTIDALSLDSDQLPRDSMGNNALLSRTLSDPTPQPRRLTTSPAGIGSRNQSPLTSSFSASTAANRTSGVFLPPANHTNRSLLDACNLTVRTFSGTQPPHPFPPLPPSQRNNGGMHPASQHLTVTTPFFLISSTATTQPDHNEPNAQEMRLASSPSVDEDETMDPDVEGAFEMDFE